MRTTRERHERALMAKAFEEGYKAASSKNEPDYEYRHYTLGEYSEGENANPYIDKDD